MAINLNTAIDTLGTALAGIPTLRVYDFEASGGVVPAAMVFPGRLTYDHTKQRGTDHLLVTVLVLVSKVSDRAARDRLAAYCDGTGSTTTSVKAALDAVTGARVEFVDPDQSVLWGGVAYLAAEFQVAFVQ